MKVKCICCKKKGEYMSRLLRICINRFNNAGYKILYVNSEKVKK